MYVSCSNGFAPWDVVRLRWQSSSWWLKNWFAGVFPLFNSTDAQAFHRLDGPKLSVFLFLTMMVCTAKPRSSIGNKPGCQRLALNLRPYLNILNTTGSPCHELTSRDDLTPLSSGLLEWVVSFWGLKYFQSLRPPPRGIYCTTWKSF